jgi:hypothetical protein
MVVIPCATTDSLLAAVAQGGFAVVSGTVMRRMLEEFGRLDDFASFTESWAHLEIDPYMADGGRYRLRRHAVFSAARTGPIERDAHQPHYQSVDYNPLHGGIERWFEPVTDRVAVGSTLTTILACCRSLFSSLSPDIPGWRIEIHQFRIEARSGEAGRPTPEGLHRDGVDYVLVLLIQRRNIASGVTGIHALDGRPLGSFTLTEPLDAAFVDDRRVAHGVTPIQPLDASAPAYRDVLVVTFRSSPVTV